MIQRRSRHHTRESTGAKLHIFTGLLVLFFLANDVAAQAQLRTGRDAGSDWPVVSDVTESPDISTTPLDEEGGERLDFSGRKVDLSLELPQRDGPWEVEEADFACDLRDCESEEFREQMLKIAGVLPGDSVDRKGLIRALNRLARVERYQAIHGVVTATSGGRVRLHIQAEAATLIERIRIRSGPFPQETIKRRLSLRSGGFWDPEVIDRQETAILDYFERQGLYNADVEIKAEPSGEHAVDLNIHIGRGKRLTINRIYVRGNRVFDYDEISNIVLDEFNFLSSFTQNDVQHAVDAVLVAYRNEGYIQARFARSDIRIDAEQHAVDLYLEIQEGPQWEIVFAGNRSFSDEKLKAALTFYQTGFIDDVEIQNAAREIRALYETRGYFFTQVDINQQRDQDGARSLFFEIDEGPVSEIRAIEFVGNTVFSTRELRRDMRTSEYDLITPSGYLQRARLNDELRRLIRRYHQAGYLGAEVSRVVMVGQDGGRDLYIKIFLHEGPQTTIEHLDIRAADDFEETSDALTADMIRERSEVGRKKLRMHTHGPWSYDLQREDLERIRTHWTDEGYGRAEIEVLCHADGVQLEECQPQAPTASCERSLAKDVDDVCKRSIAGDTIVEECQLASADPTCDTNRPLIGASMDIEFLVRPGKPTRLGRVFTVGNFATKDHVLLQELPLQRECVHTRRRGKLRSGWEPDRHCPFNPDQLLHMQANLRSLGVFDSVRIDAIGPDEDLDEASVIVKIEEGQTHYLDYRVGLDLGFTDTGNTLLSLPNEIVYRDLNFLGRAQELRLEGRFEPSVTQPGSAIDGLFDADLRAIYFDPRSYLFGRWKRPWEARFELAAVWSQLAPAPVPQTRVLSAEFRIRNRIRRYKGVFYELGLSVRQTAARDTTQGMIDSPFERVRILSITPNITIELRDNPLNPRRGYFGEVSLELAEDFFGLLGTESFTRLTTRHSGYIPLGRNVTLALNARFGVGFGSIYNGFRSKQRYALPLGERFLLGGVNTVRGFSRDSIRVTNTDEVGGDIMFTLNTELRYPIIPSINLYGTVFMDAGQLAADFKDLQLSETRMSAGVGVRWLIADLLPVLLDYGAVLNRRPGEGFGLLHFSIGYTF